MPFVGDYTTNAAACGMICRTDNATEIRVLPAHPSLGWFVTYIIVVKPSVILSQVKISHVAHYLC